MSLPLLIVQINWQYYLARQQAFFIETWRVPPPGWWIRYYQWRRPRIEIWAPATSPLFARCRVARSTRLSIHEYPNLFHLRYASPARTSSMIFDLYRNAGYCVTYDELFNRSKHNNDSFWIRRLHFWGGLTKETELRCVPFQPLSVRKHVLEGLLPRSQFVAFSRGSVGIAGAGTRPLQLRVWLWHSVFEYRGSALLVTRTLTSITIALTPGEI